MSSLRGAPAIPWLSLETSREKCATEWKSQHSQASQIAIESIYSRLVKTPNQALIMRERGREGKCYLSNICRLIQGHLTLVFIHLLSGPVCQQWSAPVSPVTVWMTAVGQVWGCFICGGLGEEALNIGFTWNAQPCAADRARELNTKKRGKKARATHKIIIVDRRDMPCRADCLPTARNRGVSEGVHCRWRHYL